MFARPSLPAHLAVAVIVAGTAVLALLGVIGRPDREERFDAKRYEVAPAGEAHPDGIAVDQVVDQDFGTNQRHGFQLNVSNSYGRPTAIQSSSPDAPDDLDTLDTGEATRIRIGDPDIEITGQHRYFLSYIQPAAGVTRDRLSLDVIYTGEQFETGRFEVVVNGFELTDPSCRYGTQYDPTPCELEAGGDGTLRTVIEPLGKGEGILIEGRISATHEPVTLEDPPLPNRVPDHRLLVAAILLAVGTVTAIAVYFVLRRFGRNEVFGGGGAADAAYAAFGDAALPPPGLATTIVSDARLADLATIEFVPPKAIEPWEGALLLRERVDERSVGAWFSAKAGADVVTLARDEDDVVLASGPQRAEADAETSTILDRAFDGRAEVRLDGSYDKKFAKAWNDVREMQAKRLGDSGWWTRPPTAVHSGRSGRGHPWAFVAIIWIVFAAGSSLAGLLRLFQSIPGAIVFAVVACGLAAYIAFRRLLPARSALGSALTLRTESFRRFLEHSEGRHVEWAWDNGLIRQYSAWAVALDEADAWQRALESSDVPPVEYVSNGPLVAYVMLPSFAGSSHPPSSSGSGFGGGGGFSGGGFSGGSVGGGGGGGGSSSGSW